MPLSCVSGIIKKRQSIREVDAEGGQVRDFIALKLHEPWRVSPLRLDQLGQYWLAMQGRSHNIYQSPEQDVANY